MIKPEVDCEEGSQKLSTEKNSDSEKIFGTAYKNSIIDKVILLTKKKIYKNRQKCKVTNIAEIKHELSVQLQYEQHYAAVRYNSNFRVRLKILYYGV